MKTRAITTGAALAAFGLLVCLTADTAIAQGKPAAPSSHPATAQAKPAPSAAPAPSGEVDSKDPDVAAAKKAALDWLALVDASKFAATYDEAAGSFQKAQKKEEWVKGIGGARPAFGKVLSRTFANTETRMNLPNLPAGKYVTVRYKTSFEKQKDGRESVTCALDGIRGWRMVSYFVQ